ncbi:FMN-dependent dehydrogenase-domain-containing protein [Kockovaella imperatae]|uniref:L-lactate dehydrogenase (cytochrome) n=1 Tax=Kockovaella imperatae TaxID=4999 RepID=A0A1Y1UGM8_9TREE|nr:FMN-dependent dehydrogenase-domain-containing protein [Kockovaella imperatae]ORX36225.1 FMN-dependent dehydrogenase-domain-containing protein [Kockovaella imperatae]
MSRSTVRLLRGLRSTRGNVLKWSRGCHSDFRGVPPLRHAEVGSLIVLSLATLYFGAQTIKLDSSFDPSPPNDRSTGFGLIPFAEVQKHCTEDDCWVVIDGKVYDLTKFAAEAHPGGSGPILQFAGRDATTVFQSIHPPGVIEHMLDPSALQGTVDPTTLPPSTQRTATEVEREITLGEIVGLPDFEEAARRKLSAKAWAYMSAGATDMYTLDLNRSSFNKILFRPRVLVDVDKVDSSTVMLGQPTSMPIFLSPTGMAGLAHPDGEKLLTAAAGECEAIYMISTNASDPLQDIVNARQSRTQPLFMQLYVDRNRPKSEALIHKINDLGLKAIFVTVDAAAPGKREADERSLAEIEASQAGEIPGVSGGKMARDRKGGGIARAKGGFIDPTLNWNDIAWLRRHTNLPIGLKGVQSVEDCVKAVEMGVEAIYLSNHGGRALDGSEPALYTLLELRKHRPDVFDKVEVYLDGGVRRGTDVIKAICLGAKGVGLGRPILYSMTYGKDGIVHALESEGLRYPSVGADVAVLRDEIHTTMKLLGVTRLDQLGPHLVRLIREPD